MNIKHLFFSIAATMAVILLFVSPSLIKTKTVKPAQTESDTKHQESNNEISVIFDMGGVLVESGNHTKVLGMGKFFRYAMMHGFNCKKRIKEKLFEFLDSLEPRLPDEVNACDDQGNLLPQILCHWMKGTYTSEQLLEKVNAAVRKRKKGLEINLIASIARMMFTPELFVQTQIWKEETLDFVKELKEAGCKVYILSNWNCESFELLQEQYQDIFDLFDGIVISGAIGKIKPDKAIYEYLLTTYPINRDRAFFIDDQPSNLKAAMEECGIYSVACTNKQGIEPVRAGFYAWKHRLNNGQEFQGDNKLLPATLV